MKTVEPRFTDMWMDEIDGYPRVVLRGECDSGIAARLDRRLDQLLRAGCRGLMVDTRGLRYLDGSCCQALCGAIERLRAAGGECVIVDQSEPLERALKLLSLSQSVEAVPTVSQAAVYLRFGA
jgi:anti-anti-sigma factor